MRLPRAFAHPAWWGALGLLLLNDHVFKGAGVLPGALTGKLSDLAGMIVAPPLFALALGAHRRAARLVAAAAVGIGFGAINLVPEAARALEHALGALHLPARVWVDPTDLWALALLPIGHALSRPEAIRTTRALAVPGWLQHGGVLLAAFACMATTGIGEDSTSGGGSSGDGPQIENATGSALSVVLASTEGAGGCSLYRDDRIALLTANAFVAPREIALPDEARAPLSTSAANVRCGAASIALPDGANAVVFWRDLEPLESFAPDDDERRLARRVVISGESGDFDLEIGADLSTFEIGAEAPPETTCPESEIAHSLEFTALAESQGFFEVAELRTASDGCLEVDWFALRADTSPDTQRLCIPDWAFPFEVGEPLSLLQEIDPLGARTLRITRRQGDEVETQLVIWNDASELEGSRVHALEPVDCVGTLSACGAYVRPLELELRGRDAPASPGEDVTISGSNPKQTRLLVGPARDVAWSAPGCEAGEARPGPSANVLELRDY